MSFDWTDYIKLARELARQAARSRFKEARLRTAISRAYYAAYIKARNHLRDNDRHSIPRQDAHQYVLNQFIHSSDARYKEVGWRLRYLRELRVQADYEDDVIDIDTRASKALKHAGQAIAILSSL